MSIPQRDQHLKKFSNATLSDAVSPCDMSQVSRGNTIEQDPQLASSLTVDVKAVADSVRIPLNCLEGIWSKASELLKTPGAIVSAPGVSGDARFVLSYSGKRPHLVIPKRGGSFSCDEDCPNWRALGICAHSVAVANLCSKLPEFVAWFKKSKKTPNLTSLAKATMPKGRGNKGSRCPRKRKSTVVTETVFSSPSVTPFHDQTPQDLQPVPTRSRSPSLPVSTAPVSQLLAVTQTNFQFSSFPPGIPYGHPGYGYYSPPFPLSPNSLHQPSTFSSSPLPPVPFTLCRITGNISVCAGCRNKYHKCPTPPDDLCIRHQEWREYLPQGSQAPQSRYGNVYYHFNTRCVQLRCPEFIPVRLEVPQEIVEQLQDCHKERLAVEFLINFP